MTSSGIAFGELRDLFVELGFSECPQEPGRLRFEHPTTGTVLLFRTHGSSELVGQREMAVVRRQLVDNGLIEATAFDRFLVKASA